MSSWSRCRPAPPGRRARVAGPGPRVRAGGPGRPVRAGGRTGRRAPGVGGGARSLLVDLHNASSDVFQLGPCRVMHPRVTCLTRRGPCKTRGLTCFAGERRRRAGKAPPGPTRPPASSSHAQSVPPIPWPRAARLNCRRARRWRNRLTRCPQKALSFGTCGFESHPPHYRGIAPSVGKWLLMHALSLAGCKPGSRSATNSLPIPRILRGDSRPESGHEPLRNRRAPEFQR